MSRAGGHPIEEFLEAITAQLDQTQDALRLKAVNRPLTFALKDFNVDLKVFVEMDAQGRVLFRPAGPNEEGASTVSIGFTTITRPMIEENTISMEMAQAPTLEELGLANDDQRRLAKIGVRNGAQLRNLEQNAGETTLSRHTGVDLNRLRTALDLARPRLEEVVDADPDNAAPAEPHRPPPTTTHPDPFPTPQSPRPPHDPFPPTGGMVEPGRSPPHAVHLRPDLQPRPSTAAPAPQPSVPESPMDRPHVSDVADRLRELPRRLRLRPGARDIQLKGRNLIEAGQATKARLDGQHLDVLRATPHTISFALPDYLGVGQLDIELPDGRIESYTLSRDGALDP